MNSPAIRHSKKHRQSLSVVSWLGEAVKEGQWNNDAEKYYGISPYAYCGGDPVNFGDYNGEDAIVSVYGDTITISANVILTGSQASQELADIYQQGINETWGSISTFEHEGKTYNLVWDIKVEANAGLDINDNLPRDGRTNYLQVIGEPRSGGKGSSVIYGYKGFIRAYGEDGLSLNESNPLPHEFGHLIGLKDRYYTRTDEERNLGKYGHPHPGWEGTLMGSQSGFGTTRKSNMQLKSVLDYVINAYSFLYGWMPYYSSLLYNPKPGIRVGTGYFHE